MSRAPTLIKPTNAPVRASDATLRDTFAMEIMKASMRAGPMPSTDLDMARLSADCYFMADAMMEARK